MGMVVQHNIAALNSNRQLGVNNSALSKNLEKLSSGYRINRAGDDAAGLAISEKMRAQIKGLESAQANAQDGISLVQTAEGALTEVHSMLNRMTELATKAANGTYSATDRQKYSDEVSNLKDEIDRISESTNFNGIKLLDGSLSGTNVSSNGTTLSGATIAKFSSANIEGGQRFSTAANAATAGKDYFSVDGKSFEIDWENDNDAKTVLNSLKGAATAGWDADNSKESAKKLTDLFNQKMQEAGISGSVKVTAKADGTFKLTSNNETSTSQVAWTGCEKGAAAATASVGCNLFSKATTGEAATGEAGKTYNGKAVAAGATFQMNINGTTVQVTHTDGLAQDATMDDTARGNLESYIRTAVNAYNTQNGLTTGYDTASGLTALKDTDFKVEIGKEGNFVVKYTGDEEVNFSFSDIGDKTVAASLGLTNGTSKSGGANGLTLQIGETDDSFQKVSVSIGNMNSLSLGLNAVDISSQEAAGKSIDVINAAIDKVSTQRGSLGAIQNRLEHTINSLSVSDENLTASESRIRDTDMAKEMMAYTQNNVLTQAAQSMLAQANQKPQAVLSLLQ